VNRTYPKIIRNRQQRDLRIAIKEKQFREDLFYRLNVVCITLPPLRNKPEDVPELVRYFCVEMRIDKPSIQDEAMHSSHGMANVSELESALRRALRLTLLQRLGLASDKSSGA
jgi:transcriptional regulator with GAF, ATPase, and Fis domain